MWPDAPGWATLARRRLWTFVFLFMPLFNKDRLRVGDLIAGTRVVMQPKIVLAARPRRRDAPAPTHAPRRGRAASRRATRSPTRSSRSTASTSCRCSRACCAATRGDAGRAIEALQTVADKIRAKIKYAPLIAVGDDERFLRDFYAALRAHLEQKMLFGQRREDKFAKP